MNYLGAKIHTTKNILLTTNIHNTAFKKKSEAIPVAGYGGP
jgi:hypothetical protein